MSKDTDTSVELRKLIAARGQCKASFTRLELYLNSKNFDHEELLVRKQNLMDVHQKYQEISLNITLLDEAEGEDDGEERYLTLCATLGRLMKSHVPKVASTAPEFYAAKLPTLEIPVFDGKEIAHYRSFKEMFDSIIDNDARITDIQKLCFLKKYLKGEPLNIIDNLPIIGKSYTDAVNLLQRRYNNKALLIQNHVNNLLDAPSLLKGTAPQLRELAVKTRQNTTALENLEQPVKEWDAILSCILIRKLDPLTTRLFQSERDTTKVVTVEELLNYLDRRAAAIEASPLLSDKSHSRTASTKPAIRPTFLNGIIFSKEEVLSGKPEPESLEKVKRRYTDGDAIAEAEPQGKAQNAMQCYLHSQAVSDKSVADCVEALIGTYLLSGGIKAAVKFVEWMRIFPSKDNLAELLNKPIPTVITEKKATLRDIEFLMDHCQSNIEEILGYKFKDPALLLEAVSHASFIRNRLTRSYERLEFLGDAILDFLITSHIFENSPDLKPGELTDLRSALVNNVTFAAYVVKLGLHKYICKKLNPQLDKAIMAFVDHQVARNHEIVEDVLYLIDEEESPMAEYVEVPKTLSDVFESLAGAIYLDSGGDLQTVWSVFYQIMSNEINEFSLRIPRQPVTILYEMVHACPKFGDSKLVNPDLPGISKVSVPVTFTKKDKMCTVHGIGGNKSQAKRAAAKLALKILNA